MNIQPVLSSIAYELGDAHPIQELIGEDKQAMKKLLDSGEFEFYLKTSERTAYDLANKAIEQTLANCEISGRDVDTVIFATDSFKSVRDTMTFFSELCRQHGLEQAYPILVSMSECANFHVALETAVNGIKTGSAQNVLLVTVDKAELASPDTRLVGGGIGVMSDAAASCLISTQVDDGFAIEGIAKEISPELLQGEISDVEELMLRVEKNNQIFSTLFQKQRKKNAGFSAEDIKVVIASNISSGVLSVFMSEANLKYSQIMTKNNRKIGHCLASDCLINLQDYVASSTANNNDLFLLYGAGPITWGGALLRATTYMDTV